MAKWFGRIVLLLEHQISVTIATTYEEQHTPHLCQLHPQTYKLSGICLVHIGPCMPELRALQYRLGSTRVNTSGDGRGIREIPKCCVCTRPKQPPFLKLKNRFFAFDIKKVYMPILVRNYIEKSLLAFGDHIRRFAKVSRGVGWAPFCCPTL